MAKLSDHVLQRMGLKLVSPSQPLPAVFHSLRVYRIEGFGLDAPSLEPIAGNLARVPYTFAVGTSVNAICQKLIQDNYVDAESGWERDKGPPPYLIIHIGPTVEHELSVTHVMEDERTITTYEAFPAAIAVLDELESRILPPLLSALACSFAANSPIVRFLPIDRATIGVARDGRTIHDIRIKVEARAFVSSKLESSEIEEKLTSGVKIASAMEPKMANFLRLALEDQDPLKRFLYFFLAIESTTHATFKKIDHPASFNTLITAPGRVSESTRDFFNAQRERWINLRDRFFWCAICVWHHLSDADIDEFRRLKEVRDQIAHGTVATPPHWAVAGAEALAKKVVTPP